MATHKKAKRPAAKKRAPKKAVVRPPAKPVAEMLLEQGALAHHQSVVDEQNRKRKPRPKTAIEQAALALGLEELANAKERALADLGRHVEQLWTEYGVNPAGYDQVIVPGITVRKHLANREEQIRQATSLDAVIQTHTKARTTAFSVAMWLWQGGFARGPATAQNLEKHAARAEKLADLLAAKADAATDEEQAAALEARAVQQRTRASQIRAGELPTTRQQKTTSAHRFRELILAGALDDDAIFKAVQKEFDLDDSKRSYVNWYRRDLKKKGALK